MSEPGFDPPQPQPQPQPGPYQQPQAYAHPQADPYQQAPAYAYPVQPDVYPQHPQPYAYQQKPGNGLRVAGEVAVLVAGSVLMVVVGGFAALFSILFWYGISNPAPGASDSGDDGTFMASVLFPGPLVALVLAWIGYAVFAVLKRRVGGLIWFSSAVLAWLLAFTVVMLQVMAR